ncbi:MAG: hypothetical protein JO348_06435 [Alphaproteobacteria bacterium]|nr:hypothetical protein [Alphaproteobacteria bacterium]MBV9419393.1 hypothetical protein [Alphaproteobacteria bacterium]MBV9540600.1 hypothetical protein [Alphaproteobacteria bacterium]
MTQTTAFRLSLGGAVVVLLLALYAAFSPPMKVCGDLAPGYAPVIAQELARSVADVHAIFGTGPSACRTAIAQQIYFITWADCLVFIPAYGVFLLFFFFAMAPRDERAALVGFILSAVAVVADYIENVCLFQITANPDVAGYSLAVLPWATGAKWLALGLGAGVGAIILLQAGRLNYPAVAACGLSLLGAALGILNPHLFGPFISNAITLSWIVFLIVDIRHALPRRGSAVAELEPEDSAA